jgi:plasmid stabilization system protein ParE
MDFSVEISPRAFRDLDELAAELKERSQSYTFARKWFLTIVDAIGSLVEMPERCNSWTRAIEMQGSESMHRGTCVLQ